MSRASVKKLLSQERPIDRFKFLGMLPEEYTYCFRSKMIRHKVTGQFTKKEKVPIPEVLLIKGNRYGNYQVRVGRIGPRPDYHWVNVYKSKPVTHKVVSLFVTEEGRKEREKWAEIKINRAQAKMEFQIKERKRKEKREMEREARLFEKGHQLVGGKLTKSILSFKRLSSNERRKTA